ncbi:MAG: hypothetical protein AAF950_03850 [Pseudomonadota bacterium]
MKFARPLLIAAVLLVAVGAALWQFVLREPVAFADVATAYAAKQVCSCRFVGERALDSCLGDFTQDISLLDVSENGTPGAETITASALGIVSATAIHQPGLGCVLRP